MFVNNEITDRGLLHKLLRKASSEVTMDEREVWARSIDGAIKDATGPRRWCASSDSRIRPSCSPPRRRSPLSPPCCATTEVAVSREAHRRRPAVHDQRHRLPALRSRSAGRPPRRRRAAQPAPRWTRRSGASMRSRTRPPPESSVPTGEPSGRRQRRRPLSFSRDEHPHVCGTSRDSSTCLVFGASLTVAQEELIMATVSVRYIVDDVDAAIESAARSWNRFQLELPDLEAAVERLRASGARFRNDVVTGVGGKQVLSKTRRKPDRVVRADAGRRIPRTTEPLADLTQTPPEELALAGIAGERERALVGVARGGTSPTRRCTSAQAAWNGAYPRVAPQAPRATAAPPPAPRRMTPPARG